MEQGGDPGPDYSKLSLLATFPFFVCLPSCSGTTYSVRNIEVIDHNP